MTPIVSVRFGRGDREYDYRVPPSIPTPAPGDKVVVDSPHQGYQVVKVISVREGDGAQLKRIVAALDDSDYLREARDQTRKDFRHSVEGPIEVGGLPIPDDVRA